MRSARETGTVAEHYRRLGLAPGESRLAVRRAYLKLARELHPDRNASETATAEFHAIADAYQAICHRAPPAVTTQRWLAGRRVTEPLRCSACNGFVIEPRPVRFTQVISFAVFSWRRHAVGLMCVRCARRAALRASAISGALGWWSLPGLILTPLAILSNASGGERDESAEPSLLFYNLLVFRARGHQRAVAQIAARLRAVGERRLPMAESFVVARVAQDPAVVIHGSGSDPWRRRLSDSLLQVLCSLAVPLLIAMILIALRSPPRAVRAAGPVSPPAATESSALGLPVAP